MFKRIHFVLITFLQIIQTKFVLFNQVFDYNFKLDIQEKLLKFYPKLLTIDVNLRLTDYQRIEKIN